MTQLPRLKAIVDGYISEHGSSTSWVSEQMGLSRQALSNWWGNTRSLTAIPDPYLLLALARVTRTPYRDVLDAALHDFGYLPESRASELGPPARMHRKGKSDGRAANKAQDDAATAPDAEGPEFGA